MIKSEAKASLLFFSKNNKQNIINVASKRTAFYATIPFLLFSIGWIKSFPRWSLYTIGFCLIASFYFMFGTFAGSQDLLLLYAWIPFLLSISIAFIMNPSTKPLKQLGKKIFNSPRLILFVLYGFVPLFFMICFDEFPKHESIFAFIIMSLLTYGLYVFFE